MNEFDSNSGLAGQLAALQRQVFMLLLALIVVTATLAGYLCFQSYEIGKNINILRPKIAAFDSQKLPLIRSFANKMNGYANQHPEFRPILVKYGMETNVPAAQK